MRTQFHPVTHLLDATALGVPPQCLGLVQPDGNLDLGAAQSPSAFTVTTAMASVLAQGKGVLPAGVREKYREKFGWVGAASGPARDLDVYVIEPRHSAQPADAPRVGPETLVAIGSLTERLEDRRRAAREEFAERFAAYDTKQTRRTFAELLGSEASGRRRRG